MKEEIEEKRLLKAGWHEGYEACQEAYNGISPSTVTEMIEALRQSQEFNKRNNFFNATTVKVNEVLSKADKELKK